MPLILGNIKVSPRICVQSIAYRDYIQALLIALPLGQNIESFTFIKCFPKGGGVANPAGLAAKTNDSWPIGGLLKVKPSHSADCLPATGRTNFRRLGHGRVNLA